MRMGGSKFWPVVGLVSLPQRNVGGFLDFHFFGRKGNGKEGVMKREEQVSSGKECGRTFVVGTMFMRRQQIVNVWKKKKKRLGVYEKRPILLHNNL